MDNAWNPLQQYPQDGISKGVGGGADNFWNHIMKHTCKW